MVDRLSTNPANQPPTGAQAQAVLAAINAVRDTNPTLARELLLYYQNGATPPSQEGKVALSAILQRAGQGGPFPLADTGQQFGPNPPADTGQTYGPPRPVTANAPGTTDTGGTAIPDAPNPLALPGKGGAGSLGFTPDQLGRVAGRPDPSLPGTPGTPITPAGAARNVAGGMPTLGKPVDTANPTGAPAGDTGGPTGNGQFVPGSPGDVGYIGAVQGDRTALQAVMSQVLQGMGIDMGRPGLFSGDVEKQVSQFLPFYMQGTGLANARQRAQDFQGIMNSSTGFGQLADAANQQLVGAGDLGQMQPEDQQAFIKNAIGSMEAGANPLQQRVDAAQLAALDDAFQRANLNGPVNYIDFLRTYAGKVPQAAKLLPLIQASTPSKNPVSPWGAP